MGYVEWLKNQDDASIQKMGDLYNRNFEAVLAYKLYSDSVGKFANYQASPVTDNELYQARSWVNQKGRNWKFEQIKKEAEERGLTLYSKYGAFEEEAKANEKEEDAEMMDELMALNF